MDKERRTSDQTDDFDIVDFDLNEYDEEFEKEEQKLQLKEQRKMEAAKSRAQLAQEQQKRKRKKKDGPLSPIRPKAIERKPSAPDCPAAWTSVLRYAPSHAQGARWGDRLPRSVRSPHTKKRRS